MMMYSVFQGTRFDAIMTDAPGNTNQVEELIGSIIPMILRYSSEAGCEIHSEISRP